jgi:hypothetical protein
MVRLTSPSRGRNGPVLLAGPSLIAPYAGIIRIRFNGSNLRRVSLLRGPATPNDMINPP